MSKTVQEIIDGSSHCMVTDGAGEVHSAVKAKIADLRDIERQLAEAQKASKCLYLIEKFSMTVTRVNSIDGAWRVRAWYQGLRGQLLSIENDDDSLTRAINRAAEMAGKTTAAPPDPQSKGE